MHQHQHQIRLDAPDQVIGFRRSQAAYLLVLVSSDGGEDRLGEAERLDPLPAGHRLVRGQLAAEVLPDDVNARLVLVHGVEDDLVGRREKSEVIETAWAVEVCPKY